MPVLPNFAQVPLPPNLLAPEAPLTVTVRTCLLEGPAFDGEGNLFFSDIIGNQIYQLTAAGSLSIFRSDSGRTNGNTFDARGRLISCEGAEFGPGGRRRLICTDLKTGNIEILTETLIANDITAQTTWWSMRWKNLVYRPFLWR